MSRVWGLFPARAFDLVLVAWLCVVGSTTSRSSASIQLSEQTASAGLSCVHQPSDASFNTQAWQTGGMAVGDFNNDGYQDLFWLGGGDTSDLLFMGTSNGDFTEESASWGIHAMHAGIGASTGDYNNDGHLDIFVTSLGEPGNPQIGKNRLYRNNGNGTFTDVALDAGVDTNSQTIPNGYGSAFGDYDLDGDLDLFVTSWLQPNPEANVGNRLFQNNGDGTFTDVTTTALGNALNGVWGFQAAFADMDGDLFPELLVSADFESSRYFVNNWDGTFTDMTVPSGTGLDDNGMGQAVGDVNNDGLLDWYVTSVHQDNPEPTDNIGNMLYINQGDHVYQEVSVDAGCNDGGWGWGTVALDLDQDGWLDLAEINGRAAGEWNNEPGKLFYNNADGSFTEMAQAVGFDHAGQGTALISLDADNDGDLELVAFTNAGPLKFYINQTEDGGNWLRIALDTSANELLAPDGFGARIIATAGGQSYVRYMNSGPSYLATGEWLVHFGLGDATQVDTLQIIWSRGYVTTLTDVAVNQQLEISAPALADFDADGVVGFLDLLKCLSSWGAVTSPSQLVADIQPDFVVGMGDLALLLGNWGSVP